MPGIETKQVGLIMTATFPILMFGFLKCRVSTTTVALAEENFTQIALVDQVATTCANYRPVVDPIQQPFYADRLVARVAKSNRKMTFKTKGLKNNANFAPVAAVGFASTFTVYGGIQVLDGTDDLDMFLVILRLVTEVGMAWVTIYKTLNQV